MLDSRHSLLAVIGASRRTVDDEGEEDSFPAVVDDDSLSEGTASSQSHDEDDGDEADRDGDGCSEITENDGEKHALDNERSVRAGREGRARSARDRGKDGGGGEGKALFNARVSDTETMMNGSKEAAESTQEAEEIHFDQIADSPSSGSGAGGGNGGGQRETFAERKRREHEEYIQKRNSDPSFVPTRGGFFLHDNRSGNGNGNGRGGKQIKSKPHGLIVDSNVSRKPQPDITHAPWRHDLHDSVNQPYRPPQNTNYPSKPVPTAPRSSPPNRSFSNTILIGNVPVIVFLPGMQSPIPFSAVPKKQHTRLPQHRPPLRRDKPVRISLPGQAPRYIFPSTERSFIFIPRALRPNQQASYRGRGRGGGGGGGGFYSRRASVYSGSAYSHAPTHTPSVSLSMSMSRRSSMGRDVSVNGATPPLGSTIPMARPVVTDSRPVVRLPPQATPTLPMQVQVQQQQQQPTSVPAPVSTAPYFPPQIPPYRENRPHPSIPMHQPRPQKTVSVADIESPAASAAAYQFTQQPQQQPDQPFHHQVPHQPHQMPMNGYAPTPDMTLPMAMPMPMAMQVPMAMQMQQMQMPMYSHMRHMSHPPPTSATPLSQIPERAIHAAPFQPVPYQQQPQPGQQAYYGQPYQASPMYAPPASGTEYPYTPAGPGPGPAPPAGPGTVAHESNGTVYYYDASQVTAPGSSSGASVGGGPGQGQPPQPQSQGQGVVGIGGMMTPPGPTTYYYPPPVQQNGHVYY
ncbi:extensin [Arthroderma uncinatum]|uniref:extensin n=1 Tax=Arthroderma uncinatum TaxID=74035 RepID=UPI00144A87EE|nr:extensin [Arthroderma uncinatum]KAF3479900.1 extensin [Arthroderma uncinatum]